MSSYLNEINDKTKKVIHLMVTSLCNRNCKYCCNKQYDLNNIPYVTDSELRDAEVLCLTGGEPFLFANPCALSEYYKEMYPNIKKVLDSCPIPLTNDDYVSIFRAISSCYHDVDGIEGLKIAYEEEKND